MQSILKCTLDIIKIIHIYKISNRKINKHPLTFLQRNKMVCLSCMYGTQVSNRNGDIVVLVLEFVKRKVLILLLDNLQHSVEKVFGHILH